MEAEALAQQLELRPSWPAEVDPAQGARRGRRHALGPFGHLRAAGLELDHAEHRADDTPSLRRGALPGSAQCGARYTFGRSARP